MSQDTDDVIEILMARYACDGYAWPDAGGRFVLYASHEAAIAMLTRERDEARAALANAVALYVRTVDAAPGGAHE